MPRAAKSRARQRDRSTPAQRAKSSRGQPRRGAGLRRLALVLFVLLGLAAGVFYLSLPSVEPLRSAPPPTTALIEARAQQAREKGKAARRIQRYVPLAAISPWLQQAVVNSEDARFFQHDGLDSQETEAALRQAVERGKLGRGASTLTQQLAKNLWLGEERSLLRKAKELILARRLETLGKQRILELYLNVVEWGQGIYGAEAAARTWFKKPAAQLSPEESAVLVAMLPAPRSRNPRRPTGKLLTRSAQVLDLYGLYRELSPADLEAARVRLRRLLPSPP